MSKKRSIEQVRMKHQRRLLKLKGVVGVGIGQHSGKPVLKVYLAEDSTEIRDRIPTRLEGYPVSVEVTGEFTAL